MNWSSISNAAFSVTDHDDLEHVQDVYMDDEVKLDCSVGSKGTLNIKLLVQPNTTCVPFTTIWRTFIWSFIMLK